MNTKQQTRDNIKNIFTRQDNQELESKDALILEKLFIYVQENKIKNICIYESLSDEVSTQELIDVLKKEGKNVYTPQMIGETEMIIIDEEYGHYEKEIDLFIIPGRSFTQEWARLGRGKWYYDRFLSAKLYTKSKKVGICYDFQILKGLKTEKHDINMDLVISN
jgi:5-formyltetrahydrofolate cyclo-ligase